MLLKDLRTIFDDALVSTYGLEETRSFFSLLTDHYFGFSKFILAIAPDTSLNEHQAATMLQALKELKQQKPIQHIIGHTYFMDLKFSVNQHTLIPRPETEELVRWVLDDYTSRSIKNLTVLDIGTGSGCIAISLAKYLKNAALCAIDISSDALDVAVSNGQLNTVKVSFSKQDIFTSKLDSKYDVIVSNPPYVRNLEKREMATNVLDFEPALALFVSDADPLLYYKAIAEFANRNLNKKGSLYLEINQYLGYDTQALLKNMGFVSVEMRKDMFGNDRMIKAIIGN